MTILVGYTASHPSKAALAEAIRMARLSQEDLLVVNAGPGGEHKHDAMVTEDGQLELQRILDASGLAAEFRQYARGRSTVDEMRDVADEVRPSVVVIGMRRRGTFGRVLMGSVADGLLQALDQPVLCVKEHPDRPAGVLFDDPAEDITAEVEPVPVNGPRPPTGTELDAGRDRGPQAGPEQGPGQRESRRHRPDRS